MPFQGLLIHRYSAMAESNAHPATQRMPRYLWWLVASNTFNAIFCALTFGSSVFVLYLADLGLNKARIGFMLSLFPFACVLAPFAMGPIMRFGLKKTFLAFWGARKLAMMFLILAPWVLREYGERTAFLVTAVAVAAFALCRAIGETGYYPWSKEFMPDAVRGRVTGLANLMWGASSALAMLLVSAVLRHGSGFGRYQVLIAIAGVFGILSVVVMAPVPGGAPDLRASTADLWRNMRQVIHDPSFRQYLGGTACSLQAMAAFSFLPLFIREELRIAGNWIVLFDAAAMVGFLAGSPYWGWASDRYGGKPITLTCLWTLGLLPWAWIILPIGQPLTVGLGLALALVYGAASVGLSIGSMRWLLTGVVHREDCSAYTSIWYACSGVAGGMAPFLAGWLLRAMAGVEWQWGHLRIHGYTLLCVWVLAATCVAFLCYYRTPADIHGRTRDYLRAIFLHDIPRAVERASIAILRTGREKDM